MSFAAGLSNSENADWCVLDISALWVILEGVVDRCGTSGYIP